MLTFLGGGVLVLAVAGGAWALFGRHDDSSTAASGGPSATSAPVRPAGPVVPGTTPTSAAPSGRSTPTAGPAAVTASAQPAATVSPTSAPTSSRSAAPTATASASPAARPPVSQPPAAKPPVTGPQRGGTVTKRAFTFRVARGDTLWDLTKQALRSTGRSTSNAQVASYVAKLYQANRAIIGPDPNLILVGSTLHWPASL